MGRDRVLKKLGQYHWLDPSHGNGLFAVTRPPVNRITGKGESWMTRPPGVVCFRQCRTRLHRNRRVRWIVLTTILSSLALDLSLRECEASPSANDVPWQRISEIAHEFVNRESPPSVWPFMRASQTVLANSPKKVLIHYLPFFVLSYENAPFETDHWAQFMSSKGINGRFANIGGYTRERPLTPTRGNSPYWRYIDTAIDILRAQVIGADGFGVNIPDVSSGTLSQIRSLCQIAAAVVPGFRIALEPGTESLKQNRVGAAELADELRDLGTCPAAYRMGDGRLLVVPFAPDLKPIEYWVEVIGRLQLKGERVAFVPDLLDPGRSLVSFLPLSAGVTSWGPRDSEQVQEAPLRIMNQRAPAKIHLWMQPVAPQDVRPKASIFWEATNTELFRRLWMVAIRSRAPYAHLLTWNDYGETTEIEPSSGTQYLFYDLSAYFIAWFKLGDPPRVTGDAIYYAHRTEIYADGEQPRQGHRPFKRMGRKSVSNEIEMVAFLTEPAVLEIEIAGERQQRTAPAGLAIFRIPAQPGRPIFRITRHNVLVLEKVSDWLIDNSPAEVNPAYFGGSSTRGFVSVPAYVH